MIFSNLLKPKWQHRNPDVRQFEVENIDDPAILNDIAQHDIASEVRIAAIRKLNELSVLYQIARHDKDRSVQELAEQRLKQLLCCQKDNCADLDTRLTWLQNTTDAEILAYVAEHGQAMELRLVAISQVEREGLLGDIAINDSISEIRLAAVAKLTQKSTLERVVKGARNRDKRVCRIAREKLDEAIKKLERPQQVRAECEAICTKLNSLEHRLGSEMSSQKLALDAINDSKNFKQENAELKRLQERWQTIVAEADQQCQTKFTNAQQAVMVVLENYQQAIEVAQKRQQTLAPLRVTKQALCEQIEAFLIELKNCQSLDGEYEEALNQRLQTMQNQWTETSTLDEPVEEEQWQARFERASQSIQKRYQKLQADHRIASQLEATCTQADNLLKGTKAVKPERLKELQTRWEEIAQPVKTSLPIFSELNERFSKMVEALHKRLQEQKEQQTQAVHDLKQLLTNLETALERGELKTAIPLEQQTRQLFDSIKNLLTTRPKGVDKRLQACTAKINELRSWQRWGNKLERENLCQQVENLLETEDNPPKLLRVTEEAQTAWKRLGASGYSRDIWERFNKASQTAYQRYREHLCQQMENLSENEQADPEKIAKMIRQAQTTWKNMGSQGHSQELWERFNQACQTAYLPCKLHFNIKARERENNFFEKQTLCERLETFVQETNWENVQNWKEVYQFVHEMEKQWRNIGATDRKLKKSTQRRFQSAMQILETHLDEERQRNCRVRLGLIGQVDFIACDLKEVMNVESEAVAKGEGNAKRIVEEKITEAISQVKTLQENWQVTVPGSRRIEREFWKTFRSACDEVFNHRKQQQDAHKKILQAYLESKISLCKQVEALANLEGEAIKTAPSFVKKFKEEWNNIKLDLNKVGNTLHKKAKATEAVEDRFDKACQQVERQYQSQLAVERRQQLDLLKQKASFCVELEQAETIARQQVLEEPTYISLIQTAWANLPKLENIEWETLIEQRFQKACVMATSVDEQPFHQDALENKETLCIRMEILAGVESPPEATQARLAYQVARLSAAMSSGKRESVVPQANAEEMERDWYLSNAVPGDQTQSLEQRFSKACQAFYSRYYKK